ncbi:TonB-dependent receptor family protein [Helicobacter cetorum]|uniref:Iron(III) dicitrate transport protein FecA, putative signal peptide n=1 Tax=Helicobacter cetorum (strain ATCC BAA-429 / MIT 00-7128) TaxID=182217 RepID=I0EMK0_HELC0|nr:TonB-dependent receptor family protein [Helicobacter cetorum]AFI04169.1 Iron(III) dicitrate transport protein FecA, putative signal peptide [Helicobacter cetorum MIT 00-7128]
MKKVIIVAFIFASDLYAIKTHRLGKVETSGVAQNEEAPLNWKSKEVRNYMGSRTIISHKQLTQTANQSIEEALQNVPGVHIRNATGIGAVPSFSIRGFGGGGPGRNNTGMVLVNGIPVYIAPYADISMPIFPVTFQSVDRISVTKGGESVQYGPNAFGGVINIITKGIPHKWVNQVSERTTFWGKAKNGGFVNKDAKNINKSLGNNMLFDTYLRTAGMINKHFGVQIQANWIKGQGFRYNSPTSIQNYMLDLLYQINDNNKITAFFQYYNFFMTNPGSLGEEAYEENRFQNNRPNNANSGRAKRWGVVYHNFFGDTDKIGGNFTFSYYGHDMARDIKMDSNYLNVNDGAFKGPIYTDQNYPGFSIWNYPRRYIMNAFEPNLNLVVNTDKIKQTFNVGMRFMTMDMQFKALQSSCNYSNKMCHMSPPSFLTSPNSNLEMFNNYTAVWLSDKIEFFKGKLVFTPGVRYTFLNYDSKKPIKGAWTNKRQKQNEWSPAFNISYKPMENWIWYANYRRSFIPPQHKTIGIFRTNYNQIFDEVEVGQRYSYKDKLSFNANYFVIFANRYYAGGYSHQPVNARSQGVELELYYTPIRGLQFHMAYTYIDARITSRAKDKGVYFKGIVNHPFDIYNKRLPYVSPNQFIFDMMYTYKQTTFGLSSYFYSRSYSSILNQVANDTVCSEKIGESVGLPYGCNSVGLLPWYWVWNIQVSSVLWQSGRHKITGSLQVNNLFNMKYYFRGIGTSPTGREPAPGRSVTAYLNYEF